MVASHSTENGLYLVDSENEEVLLPKRFVSGDIQKGDQIEVFVYRDNKERWIATTKQALIEAGQTKVLKVNNVTRIGAWAEMGIDKELLIPFSEQADDLEPGQVAIVHCYIDNATQRLVGSTKLRKHLNNEKADYSEMAEVCVVAWYPSDLGMNVIVDGKYIGLIHKDAMLGPFPIGSERTGFVAKQRPDNKLDIVLKKPGFKHIEPDADLIISMLEKEDGFLPYTDKTDPETIRAVFQMSKKVFKKAIGSLYKQRMIVLEDEGIRLND